MPFPKETGSCYFQSNKMKSGAAVFLLWIPLLAMVGMIQGDTKKDGWQALFNGKDLQGWDSYLGPSVDSTGKRLTNIPVGLNSDPHHVFSVTRQDGEPAIRISGEGFGAISTRSEFGNFHLQLKFKWGSNLWGPKKNKKRDSGLLYFSVGPQGADNGAWMRSQEFQIEEGNCGEYWGCAGAQEDVAAVQRSDSSYVYHPGSPLITFSAAGKAGRYCRKVIDAEKPTGEWNTIDLYCFNGSSVHLINGQVVMRLQHSAQLENGRIIPLLKGKLQIQSEGAEVFYKDIRIASIAGIPAQLKEK